MTAKTSVYYGNNECVASGPTSSTQACCDSSGNLNFYVWTNSGNCCGTMAPLVLPATCTAEGTSSAMAVCSKTSYQCPSGIGTLCQIQSNATVPPTLSFCFHIDSIITYRGKHYTYAQLLNHDECSVPHTVKTNGLRICTLDCISVTPNHLLYDHRGKLKRADEFTEQDYLGQYPIRSIEREYDQLYFGLNCFISEVHVGSIKASTFGDYHVVPSWYMKIAGGILGINRASRWGDNFVQVLIKYGML